LEEATDCLLKFYGLCLTDLLLVVRVLLYNVREDAESIALILYIMNVTCGISQLNYVLSLDQLCESDLALSQLSQDGLRIQACLEVVLVL